MLIDETEDIDRREDDTELFKNRLCIIFFNYFVKLLSNVKINYL